MKAKKEIAAFQKTCLGYLFCILHFIPILNLGHLLKYSGWPFYRSVSAFSLLTSFVIFFKYGSLFAVITNLILLTVRRSAWWNDVSGEGRGGEYTPLINDGLKRGMILFIFREVCFFASFFWTFFHCSLNPDVSIGEVWPPLHLKTFNPFSIPLLNTIVLLGRGATVTWSHHNLLGGKVFNVSLVFTVFLGVYFRLLQGYEYLRAFFTVSDRVYGSVFFMATGFHGIHVLVGSIFLLACLIRRSSFNSHSHLGYELAIWYWHFVDVVWIFLFRFIYLWRC